MSDPALVRAIERVLNASPNGLTERDVRRAVIEEIGLCCTPREVREILHSHLDRFVSLAGGVWRSRAAVKAEKIDWRITNPIWVVDERGEGNGAGGSQRSPRPPDVDTGDIAMVNVLLVC